MTSSEASGYGKPPKSTRFQKGQSGNPKGRPRNRRREIPHHAVLGQMVTMREGGQRRRVTAAEAFLLQLIQKGLAGDTAAARAALEAIEKARVADPDDSERIDVIIMKSISSGADAIIDTLNIAVQKHPTDEKRTRWELNPWIVDKALERLGERNLSASDQKEVWKSTRTPHKVTWPSWWSYFG